MTVYALINELHAKKIKLWEEGGQLKFKAAKGALTGEIRERLIRNKNDIVAFLQQVASARRIPPIRPVNRAELDRLPLSFSQERLWFITQLDTGNTSYNVPLAARIRGALDIDHVDQAMNLIIARHENLRTIFPGVEGQVHQLVLDELDFKVERIDLSQLADETARNQRAQELCMSEAATPFDLATGPLIRGKVLKLGPQEHIVMLNMHHIVSDGWSMGVLLREISVSIEALRRGQAPALAALPIQYLDYGVWQRNWLEQGGVLKQQLGYWKEKLAGVPETLNLATDYPRPAVQSFVGATYRFTVEAALTEKLKSLAEEQGGTLYMALLAAYKVLLYRYTMQEDICIGSAIANRQYGETESLIGMFVNTLALRTQLTGEDTFNEVLARVKTTCLEAYENQDAPFDKVVDLVLPHRNIAVNPIYQIIVVLQNTPLELGERIELYPLEYKTSNLDQIVELTESPQGLKGLFEYSTALYKPQTIERIVTHFIALCREITARPDAKLKELEYLSEAQKKLLAGYNGTRTDYPSNQCIHELFAEQVAQDPQRVAVVYEQEKLTYGELYERSNELALYLQSLGVGPDHLIGLCVEKSLDMVVGILGILQAGGAYVPLDPDYPDSRLEHMLQDCKAAIVLTQEKLKDKLSLLAAGETQLIALDTQWPQIRASAAGRELTREVRSNHLAYVIYTSGSTGKPKGVMVEHRPVNRLVKNTSFVSMSREDTFLQISSLSFDAATLELWGPLLNGGKLVVAPHGKDAIARIGELVRAHQITILWLTSGLFQSLVKDEIQTLSKVRTVITGGDVVPIECARSFLKACPQSVLINGYGPTENTTFTCCYRASGGLEHATSLPIGKPIANTRVYILDRHNNLQPEGVPGELCIAGDGLARGYLNSQELTREKFVDDPFEPGARMYRSGDLARWLPDGNIEFLGRQDTQVKIRGFRIEIGEIEAKLGQHPCIKESVVVAQGPPGDRYLVAFYVTDEGEPSAEELRAHLQKSLPEFMLPGAFVRLDSIPLTPHGKIDRRSLEQTTVQRQSGAAYVAPRNATEAALIRIWAQLLGLDAGKIGVNDNFFELGGHSLLATQLISKLRSQLGIEVPLKTIFNASTVAHVAQAVMAIERQHEWTSQELELADLELEDGSL